MKKEKYTIVFETESPEEMFRFLHDEDLQGNEFEEFLISLIDWESMVDYIVNHDAIKINIVDSKVIYQYIDLSMEEVNTNG